MNVFIVYAHPSEDSLTARARDSFIAGLEKAGHTYTVSDLYKMNFKTDMSEEEYKREAYYKSELPVPDDVKAEHEKINAARAIVFIYPVFWSDCPAKLVGWFDRVWTFGFAYGAGAPAPNESIPIDKRDARRGADNENAGKRPCLMRRRKHKGIFCRNGTA